MRAKEVKWATGGFVGGFLLCYLIAMHCQLPQKPEEP
jgi:hypothetical protein